MDENNGSIVNITKSNSDNISDLKKTIPLTGQPLAEIEQQPGSDQNVAGQEAKTQVPPVEATQNIQVQNSTKDLQGGLNLLQKKDPGQKQVVQEENQSNITQEVIPQSPAQPDQPAEVEMKPDSVGMAGLPSLEDLEKEIVAEGGTVQQTPAQPIQQAPLQSTPPAVKEVVRDRVVYKGSRRGFLFRLKRLSCTAFIVFLVSLILLTVTVLFRPPVIWEPLKALLNGSYNPPNIAYQDVSVIESYINQTITSTGTIPLLLDENQTSNLVRDRFGGGDQRVDLEPGILRFVVDLDTESSRPLWMIIDLQESADGELYVSRIGFGRLSFPSFINKYVSDFAFRSMNLAQGGFNSKSTASALQFFVRNGSNITTEITEVRFDKNQMTIYYEKK